VSFGNYSRLAFNFSTYRFIKSEKLDDSKEFEIVADDDVINNIENLLKANSDAVTLAAQAVPEKNGNYFLVNTFTPLSNQQFGSIQDNDAEIIDIIIPETDDRKKRSLPDDAELETEISVKKRRINPTTTSDQSINGSDSNHKISENVKDIECVEID
jgi:hypothetical protein